MLLATFCIGMAQQNYLAGLLVVGASSLGVFWGEGSFLLKSERPVDRRVQSVVESVCAAVSAVMGAFCRDGLALCVFEPAADPSSCSLPSSGDASHSGDLMLVVAGR